MTASAFTSLAAFQDALARTLEGEPCALTPQMAALVAQPGFAVYRNGVVKHAIDALQANFPAVAHWAGEPWFRAAAFHYVRQTPPRVPMLIEYGATFPAFLACFEPAAAIPHVAHVARLDRMWTEAHIAPEAAVLDPARVAGLCPQTLSRAVLHPHPSARWAWFADGPAFTIWSRNRDRTRELTALGEDPEGALLVRPRDGVTSGRLDAGEHAFLNRCAEGGTLADAAHAALEAAPATDLERLMCHLLAAGAFSRITLRSDTDQEIRDEHDPRGS